MHLSSFNESFYASTVKSMLKFHVSIAQAEQLRKGRMFIDRHFDDALDLRSMAAAAHCSPYHFHRLFRKAYGLTPLDYRRNLQVRQALKTIKHTATATELAFQVGYESPGQFKSTIKKLTGKTLTEHRRCSGWKTLSDECFYLPLLKKSKIGDEERKADS